MDHENFKQTFINQYKEEVHEIYVESAHGHNFNVEEFNSKLSHVWAAAHADGINEDEFQDLVCESLPEHYDHVVFPFHKKAA